MHFVTLFSSSARMRENNKTIFLFKNRANKYNICYTYIYIGYILKKKRKSAQILEVLLFCAQMYIDRSTSFILHAKLLDGDKKKCFIL